jgi:hypothetical protein
MEMVGLIPNWLVAGQLATVDETYSFNLNPLRLPFKANARATVKLSNGQLPEGLSWTVQGSNVVVTGESINISEPLDAAWTYRITNPNGMVADRTFNITVNPLAETPSWAGQLTQLGYIGSGYTAQFTVAATVGGRTLPTYSLVSPVPSGLSIDRHRGIISYTAPQTARDAATSFTVRATLRGASSDLDCKIMVLTVPHVPVWINPISTLRVAQGSYLEGYLVAFDPQGAKISYSIFAADADFPFKIDADGLLYGKAPAVKANQSWTVTLRADSINGGEYNIITVTVTRINEDGVLTWRVPDTELLDVTDGRRAVYDVGAHSTRTVTVRHGITGGQCPPGLILDKIQGCLVGYVDYHATDKDYWFTITATDDVDIITRVMHMQVTATFGYQFGEIIMPLWGDVKQRWQSNNGFVMGDPGMQVNVSVQSNQYSVPGISIIRGLDSTSADVSSIVDSVSPALQQMRLSIGPVGNVVVDSHSNQLIYRRVIDPQAGAADTAQHPNGQPATINPPSLHALRDAFASACGFANAGLGSRASAVATVDAERGVISAVSVISTGNGYVYSPEPVVFGSGVGAKLRVSTRVLAVDVRDPGQGWVVGERVVLDLGSNQRPAQAEVTAIDELTGRLLRMKVTDGGSYIQAPVGKIFIANAAGGLAGVVLDLGIDQVQVIDGGIGYDQATTTIVFAGSEQLEPWQSQWEPLLPMSLVTPEFVDTVLKNSRGAASSILDGAIWQVGDLIYSVQGLYWQGTTAVDSDMTSWDGGTTRLQETIEPRETLIDQSYGTFDLANTTLDHGPNIRPDVRANWGRTLIDDGTTAFDFYATIFDVPAAPTESSTVIKRWIRLSKPQLSGFNITDTR